MRKITKLLITISILMIFTFSVQCSQHYYGPSHGSKYYPGGNRHHDYYDKHDRKILKEIGKNERRIVKLENKIREYKRRRHYKGHYRDDYYTVRIRDLEREIRHLEKRNHYLRSLLHRR